MKRKVYTTANTGHTRRCSLCRMKKSPVSGLLRSPMMRMPSRCVSVPPGAGVLQSVVICSELLKSAGLKDDSSYRFLISTTPVDKTLYPIITKSGKPVIRVSK